MKILIVYGTSEGQTRKISQWVSERIRTAGHDIDVHDSALLPFTPKIGPYDAVIVAASVHQGSYQSSLTHFIKGNLDELQAKPTIFLSVSLASAMEGGEEEAQQYVDKLLDDTQWRPTQTMPVAGALLYTRYDFFKRQIMKLIVWKGGGPTDTSQDHEFTDWDALGASIDTFVETVRL